MATFREKSHKNGKITYELRATKGRGKSYSKSISLDECLSQKTREKLLSKECARFDDEIAAGQFKNRSEKKAAAQEELAKQQGDPTLEQFCKEKLMPHLRSAKSLNTVSSMDQTMRLYIFPFIINIPSMDNDQIKIPMGKARLSQIETSHINALLTSLQDEKKLANASVVRARTNLRICFNFAVSEGLLASNPVADAKVPKPRADEPVPKEDDKALSEEELNTLTDAMKDEPLKWRLMVRFLLDTGVRCGEAVGLRWDHVDYQQKSIFIEKSTSHAAGEGIFEKTTKNRHERDVYPSDELFTLLRQQEEDQKRTGTFDTFVFTQRNSKKQMYPTSPTQYLRKLAIKNGWSSLYSHKLRHTFASLGVKQTTNIKALADLLGDSVETTLRVYVHSTEAEKRKTASGIQAAIPETDAPNEKK